MNNITFGQYIPGKSWIYKLDPRTKIFLTIALIVLIFLIPDLLWMTCALGVFLIIFLTTRISLIKVLKSLKGVIFLLLFTVVLQLVYTKGTTADPTPLYTFNMQIGLWQLLICLGIIILYFFIKKYLPLRTLFFLLVIAICFIVLWKNPFVDTGSKFSWIWPFENMKWADFNFDVYMTGLKKSGFIFIRFVLMISITQMLTLTTMSMDINNGLEWLLSPLKLIKLPVSTFAMLVSLTLRFIPTLLSESRKIMNAQASRGVDFNEGSLKDKVNQVIALLIPMLVISFKRADELSDAMEARGYVIGAKRTRIDILKFRFLDYFALFVVISMFVAVILHMVGVY